MDGMNVLWSQESDDTSTLDDSILGTQTYHVGGPPSFSAGVSDLLPSADIAEAVIQAGTQAPLEHSDDLHMVCAHAFAHVYAR